MILSSTEIKDFIISPQNKHIIDFQVNLKKEHELHLAGLGLDQFIDKVDGIENESYLQVKKKLKNAITVKAYEKVLRPKDKIVTAKGGSIIYEFSDESEELENKLKSALHNLNYKGYGLTSYTNQMWLNYGIWIDPMGITLVEYILEEKENEDGIFYEKTKELKVDYISIYERLNGAIYVNYHDFEYTSFDKIEYLILNEGTEIRESRNPQNEQVLTEYNVFRVIDDEKDEIWLQQKDDTENVFYKEGSQIEHGFERVPAIFNSNRVDKASINRWFTTYCAESLIVAKDYLNDYIDFRIYKKKLGIPRFWELKTACRRCQGTGTVENPVYDDKNVNDVKYITCPSCHGSMHNTERVLTDIVYLDLLGTETQSNIPPSGAVTLPTDIQQRLWDELDMFEFDIAEVVWGQGSAVDKERRDTTAFEISVRNEGKIDKLRTIEHNKSEWQTALINLIGKGLFEDKYKGVIISPATQFIMLTPTESRQVYLESKRAKSSEEQLTKLWIDYLTAEYESDPISLERQLIIMMLTPMFHFDLIEAWEYLTPEERLIKKNLEQYIFRYEHEGNSILDVSDDGKKLQEIKQTFVDYANEELINTKQNDTSIQQNTTE